MPQTVIFFIKKCIYKFFEDNTEPNVLNDYSVEDEQIYRN